MLKVDQILQAAVSAWVKAGQRRHKAPRPKRAVSHVHITFYSRDFPLLLAPPGDISCNDHSAAAIAAGLDPTSLVVPSRIAAALVRPATVALTHYRGGNRHRTVAHMFSLACRPGAYSVSDERPDSTNEGKLRTGVKRYAL